MKFICVHSLKFYFMYLTAMNPSACSVYSACLQDVIETSLHFLYEQIDTNIVFSCHKKSAWRRNIKHKYLNTSGKKRSRLERTVENLIGFFVRRRFVKINSDFNVTNKHEKRS